MELALEGLQNAGKTSLVNAIATGGYSEEYDTNRGPYKGNVTIKLWDLGGQRRFPSLWERYCRRGLYYSIVVDAADRDSVPVSRSELHDLLTKLSLSGIPLLILGLESIKDTELCCYMNSCKDSVNIDAVIDWLIKPSKMVM